MRDALYDNAKLAVNEYPKGKEASIRRDQWLWNYPAQVSEGHIHVAAVVLVSRQVIYCESSLDLAGTCDAGTK